MPRVTSTTITIAHTWNGQPAAHDEQVVLHASVAHDMLVLRIDATWHGDPLPAAPVGRCDGLWEYEVVELFLLGTGERYLELELGPGGHHLALELEGRRKRRRAYVPVHVHCLRQAGRWQSEARVAVRELPPGVHAWNAYAIAGTGADRRYLAMRPMPGERPDFHQLEHFAPLPEALRAAIEAAREAW